MPKYYDEKFTPGSNPTVELNFFDGHDVTLEGEEALANSEHPQAMLWQLHNPIKTQQLKYVKGSKSLPVRVAKAVHNFANDPEPTLFGRIADQGTISGGLLGAGTGMLGGLLANWIGSKLTGKDSPALFGTLGALAGGTLGGLTGYVRKQVRDKEKGLAKSAAMYHDPRNFILEKLQSANDLGYAEKAKLAGAVRNLDYATATRLADAVRGALGFGIGAIISKFIFGASGTGTLFGGLAGVLGAAALHHLPKLMNY